MRKQQQAHQAMILSRRISARSLRVFNDYAARYFNAARFWFFAFIFTPCPI